MIRWNYVIPRLFVACLLCLVARFTMNPVLRWAIMRGGESVTGARVEIASLRSSLSSAELRLDAVAVADPYSTWENLFEAEQAIVDIDLAQMLRRRVVVNEGRLSGVSLNTPRRADGAISGSKVRSDRWPSFAERVTDVGEKWLDQVSDKLESRLEGDLHSVSLGRDLMRRWPEYLDRTEATARELHDRSRLLLRTIAQIKEQPLQSIEHYQQILQECDSLRRDSVAFRNEFSRLRQQFEQDRNAVQDAKEHDVAYLQQRMAIAKLDPEAISSYLLGPEASPHLEKLAHWIVWGRKQFSPRSDERPSAGRGWDVQLPGMGDQPSFLIRSLLVDGVGSAGGNPFQFAATVSGVTSQPDRHGKPMEINLSTTGAIGMTLQAVLDHTGDVPADRVTFNCLDVPQPQRTLGSASKIAVHLAPGRSRMQGEIDLTGLHLRGLIRFVQPDVAIAAEVSESLGGSFVAHHVATIVSEIDDIKAEIQFDGTLQSPRWQVKSNLGDRLAEGLQTAFSNEIAFRQQQFMALAMAEIDGQFAKLDNKISEKQQELLSKVGADSEQFSVIRDGLARFELSNKVFGVERLIKKTFRQ